jgi:hypothetical protein
MSDNAIAIILGIAGIITAGAAIAINPLWRRKR